jgi:DNA-binding SARP family transcriptional activator
LLGPFELTDRGRPIDAGRRRERCLLGLLLLQPAVPIPASRLIDLLWDGRPPPSARSSLHAHVSRLRSRCGPGADASQGIRLVSRGGGYLAAVDRHDVDAHRFQDLVRRAGEAVPGERIGLLRQALSLWRGPLLEDVASARLRDRVGADLTELRITATEQVIDVELAAGRHHQLLGELFTLAAEYPLHERFAGALMLALYRSGRYADALTAYHRLRAALAETLGADPGPELRTLHISILRRDAGLAEGR